MDSCSVRDALPRSCKKVSMEGMTEQGESGPTRPGSGELGRRVAAAAVLLPPVLWLVWKGGVQFAIAASVVAALSSFEFYRLALGRRLPEVWPAMAAATLLPLLPIVAEPTRWELAMGLLLGVSVISWSWSAARGDVEEGGRRASALVSGCVFCGSALLCLVELRQLDGGGQWVFCTLGAVWANDISAYFGGRLLGRHQLAPRVSPGKTWEGWAIGWLGALLIVESATLAGLLHISWLHAGAIAGLASVFGPLGDLSKSLLKRARGVKDAGRLIPGHGGMLDRIDSLLFTSPVVLAYVKLCGL